MSIAVLNTSANLTGKTLIAAENADTITGLKTFNRGAAAPFAVDAASTKVANLDADKVDGIEGTNLAEINNTETIASVWTFAAKPVINAGLQFPAVQVVSADANTLDDYEEGTWTPVVASTGGGAATYSSQNGYYVKKGKEVTVGGIITLATKGTLAAGTITITGLPFASGSGAGEYAAVCVPYWAVMTTAVSHMGGYIAPSTSVIQIVHTAAAAVTITATAVADLAGTTSIIFTATYRAAN